MARVTERWESRRDTWLFAGCMLLSALALLMLLSTGYVFFWAPLVFPLWVLMVSVNILFSNLRSVPASGS